MLDHSEHALLLLATPTDGPTDPRITLRMATRADACDLFRLLADAFGEPASELTYQLGEDSWRTLVVEHEGTIRLTLDQGTGSVYGLAVAPAWQGRGIGRDVLRRVCHQLRDAGARRVCLEVAVDNDRALRLYTSLGVTLMATGDYYALPLGRRRRSR